MPAPENIETLLPLLTRLTERRAAVVGDLMLDVYLWGKVSRISPEAPVPVFSFERRTSCPGGAANVARNVATLKAHALVCGVTGDDAAADELEKHFSELKIDAFLLRREPGRPTTEKRRIIASGQQLLREDFEDVSPISETARRQLTEVLQKQIASGAFDVIIFEDYDKGVLSHAMVEEVVAAARRRGIVTALDPKPGHLAPCRGLTVMKPNRSEAFALAGLVDTTLDRGIPPLEDPALQEAAGHLLKEWQPDHLLISLAGQGMMLCSRGQQPVLIPTRAREVYDVSGAGDTVTATFALALASGASPEEAARLANIAAGIVVGKVGTVPVLWEDLHAEIKGSGEAIR